MFFGHFGLGLGGLGVQRGAVLGVGAGVGGSVEDGGGSAVGAVDSAGGAAASGAVREALGSRGAAVGFGTMVAGGSTAGPSVVFELARDTIRMIAMMPVPNMAATPMSRGIGIFMRPMVALAVTLPGGISTRDD